MPEPSSTVPSDTPSRGTAVASRSRDERDMPSLLVALTAAYASGATELTVDEVEDELARIGRSKRLSATAKGRARKNLRERVLFSCTLSRRRVARRNTRARKQRQTC